MYASGSTWLYNTARQVAQAMYPDTKVAGSYAERMDVLKRLKPSVLNVVKTHDLGLPEASFLAMRATRIVLSIRDPRDAVTSLMQHMGHDFASDKRAELFTYEAGFTDDIATLDRLAAFFGGTLNAQMREHLFRQSRRDAIEAKIARLEELPTVFRDSRSGDVLDMDTQWHLHHAGRTGEVGRWQRLLTPAAAREIERRMNGWMRLFGYLA
jgi:hypothetical protein